MPALNIPAQEFDQESSQTVQHQITGACIVPCLLILIHTVQYEEDDEISGYEEDREERWYHEDEEAYISLDRARRYSPSREQSFSEIDDDKWYIDDGEEDDWS